MFQKISSFLGKYFHGHGTGVVRMNNAINQFKSIVNDLDKAASEIGARRAALDAEKHRLLDQVDGIESQLENASADLVRALRVSRQINTLIS